jgi:PAT family beta-lactamase induction signal transducer AmpG
MHVPNLFYLLIAMANRRVAEWMLYPAAFVHEFAYGFGFAAYSLFLMMIAQRREFKTTHYAFGTGLGALCGVAAGIVSAILLASVSYIWFFVAVCVLTIPGMLTLLVIPME